MHRPAQRRDSLRQRVYDRRAREEARARRVYGTVSITRRTLALFAALVMVGAIATVTQVASAGRNRGNFVGSVNECAITADQLDVQVEDAGNGVRHYHFRRWGWHHRGGGHDHRRGDRGGNDQEPTAQPTPPEGCDEENPTTEPTEPGTDPTEDPGTEPTEDPGAEPTEDPGTDPGTDPGEDPGEDPGTDPGTDPGEDPGEEPQEPPAGPLTPPNPDLDLLGRTCENSALPIHTGFQEAPACVETAMGEVAPADKNVSLLITSAPTEVESGEDFAIQVSTRNLIRNRFLGAAAGGYYRETSVLTEDGLTQGHFHCGVYRLDDPTVAPEPNIDPNFFAAVEDSAGGAEPDVVEISISGTLDDGTTRLQPGLHRLMCWAGDPTHRVPLMQFARHPIAADVVRINVT